MEQLPATETALNDALERVKEEMISAGRARNFSLAREKEQVLVRLENLEGYLFSDKEEKNLEWLNEKIDAHVDKRQWDKAESLQQVVLFVKRRRLDTQKDETENANKAVPCLHDRITVLRSHPLVYMDLKNKKLHRCGLPPDFKSEEAALVNALKHAPSGRKINVTFAGATTSRLAAFLAAPGNRVLHYSGNSCSEFLAMENWGAMKPLPVDKLKDFIGAGPGHLKFVFLSACWSDAAGQEFIEAGIPHVVCCHHDVGDEAAIEFTGTFYSHLASGQNLRQAFNMAREAVAVASFDQDAKFVLLPDKSEGDSYHDVQIFFTESADSENEKSTFVNQDVESDCISSSSNGMIPEYPKLILGREISMFNVLRHLKEKRLIQITDKPGMGKTTVGEAVCSYIEERKDAFSFEEIFWLPIRVPKQPDGNELIGCFHEIVETITNDRVAVSDQNFRTCTAQITRLLSGRNVGKRSLIFVDGCQMHSDSAISKLQLFLEALFHGASTVSVILLCPSGQEIRSKAIDFDARVELGPLDMKSSVLLFAKRCRFVSQGLWPAVRTPLELANLLVPKSQEAATRINPSMTKRCSEIFALVGEGRPRLICSEAEEISAEQYEELVKIGMRLEFQRHKYDTRFVLDQDWKLVNDKYVEARATSYYGLAQQHKNELEELEQLRTSLPTLQELKLRENDLRARQDEAARSNNLRKAKELEKPLAELQQKIKQEEEASEKASVGTEHQVPLHESHSLEDMMDTDVEAQAMINATQLSNLGTHNIPISSDGITPFTISIRHMSVVEFEYSRSHDASAIVCATNESCYPVPDSVCGAVSQAGGNTLQSEVSELEADQENNWGPVRCPTGEARIVGPSSESRHFGDLNVPYVIFAVGPTYAKDDSGDSLKQKDELLRLAYRSSLEKAKEKGLEAVGFSLISAGHRSGEDLKRPLRIALEEIAGFRYKELRVIQLCAFEKRETDILNVIARKMGLLRASAFPSTKESNQIVRKKNAKRVTTLLTATSK